MKKRFMSLIMVVTILIFGAVSFTGCSSNKESKEDSFQNIKDRGYITVGLDDTFAPMGFRDENEEIVGFDVDLAKEAFKRMGLQVKFQPIDWAMKETELNSGNIDLIWNGYSITDERKEKVQFSKPYLQNRQVIVTLVNSDVENKEDLKDKKVAAQSGSSSLDAINKEPQIASSFEGGEPILFDSNNEAFMDLESGRVDAVVADEIQARYYMSKRGMDKYKVLKEDFGSEEYGVGMRKNDVKLTNTLNETLDQMKKDGTCEKISKKWFGSNIVK